MWWCSRLLLFSVCVVAGLYIAKVWLVYVLVDLTGFVTIIKEPPPGEDFGDAVVHGEDPPSPNASAAYLAASRAWHEGEYVRAHEQLQGCDAEDAACLCLRGELRLVGAGVQRNLSEAMNLFTAAADRGDANAQYALGALHSNLFEGNPADLRRNEALAVLYLYAASVAGHPGALMAMGYRHAQGYGVPKACNTAALNYIEVARKVADVYSAGMPQAVELVRLGVEGKDRKVMTASEVNLFVEIASSGDANIAAAVGKRYLLGIDGFRQNYKRAAHHLQIAADKNHGGAMALLGYMYCLGLGVQMSLDVAYSYFVSSGKQHDSLGKNGLGYIYFHGTEVVPKNLKMAFQYFNESAYGGSADGMFNLASLYLTGTGIEQSFQRAAMWYTQALDRGHTPAAYTLAVMHLNGVGTIRNCQIAVDLLKRVCERGSWVSQKLQEAYDRKEMFPESAAWLFLRLAEAGHEVSQMNLAHLLDTSSSYLFLSEPAPGEGEPSEEARAVGKIHAQRHYEMSAEQGNALSELRLGDYAYYGWGIRPGDTLQDDDSDDIALDASLAADAEEVRFVHQEADPELSLGHYKRTANMRITGEWMQPFVARASFNLGYMYQFGIGVPRDMPVARRYYRRCFEVDPAGVEAPVTLMLALLAVQVFVIEMPPLNALGEALLADSRTHIIAVHLVLLLVLLRVRSVFTARRESRSAGSASAAPAALLAARQGNSRGAAAEPAARTPAGAEVGAEDTWRGRTDESSVAGESQTL